MPAVYGFRSVLKFEVELYNQRTAKADLLMMPITSSAMVASWLKVV